MIKAHKIKLNPTKEQEAYLFKACSAARVCYNWGVSEYNRRLDAKEKVNGWLLKKEFIVLKNNSGSSYAWINNVTTWALQGAFDDVQAAFSGFFKKHKNGTIAKSNKPRKDGKPHGWPNFKSRNHTTPAFYLANKSLKFDGHFVQFDKKRCGAINMAEPLRFYGKVMAGRITYKNMQWWLSVQVDVGDIEPNPNLSGAVGVDLGIKYLAVTSDGEIFDNPKPFYEAQAKLRRLQRKLDRQRRANNPENYNEDGTVKAGPKQWVKSERMKDTEKRIAKLSARVANIRNAASHELTSTLTNEYEVIALEDLNIKGMMSNRKLAKAIGDSALYEKRRQIEYKAEWNGNIVVFVDKWFPSSKTCNHCGWVNAELKLSDRRWTCQECGTVIERDGNAAQNIRDEALRIINS